MTTFSDHIKRVMALGLTNEQFAQVVLILADVAEMGSPAHEKIKEGARRRAARRRARQDVSESEWYSLRALAFERDGYACTYCGDTEGPHEVDHIVPLSRGGTSSIDNLTVSCRACNASKRDKLISEWAGR